MACNNIIICNTCKLVLNMPKRSYEEYEELLESTLEEHLGHDIKYTNSNQCNVFNYLNYKDIYLGSD